MENKKIISEINRIKELFNYGALISEQTISATFTPYDKVNKTPKFTNGNSGKYMTEFINKFLKAENTKDKDFGVISTMIKYIANINGEDKTVILKLNNSEDFGYYYIVEGEEGNYTTTHTGLYELKDKLVFKS